MAPEKCLVLAVTVFDTVIVLINLAAMAGAVENFFGV
jgi:hypothetical protein